MIDGSWTDFLFLIYRLEPLRREQFGRYELSRLLKHKLQPLPNILIIYAVLCLTALLVKIATAVNVLLIYLDFFAEPVSREQLISRFHQQNLPHFLLRFLLNRRHRLWQCYRVSPRPPLPINHFRYSLRSRGSLVQFRILIPVYLLDFFQ